MGIDLQIRDDYLHFNGLGYFRGHADALLLGDVGCKRSSARRTPYLEPQGEVLRKNLPVHATSVVALKGKAVGRADVGIGVDVPGLGRLDAGAVAGGLASGELVLLKISVLPSRLWALANENPVKALRPLKAAGSKGRMLHQVFVVLQARLAAAAATAAGIELSGGSDAITLRLGAGATLTLGRRSTFAYLLLDPVWDARQQKNWTRVVDAKEDPWSLC